MAHGHFGPARERQIFGQRVLVERAVGSLEVSATDRNVGVIVVPWDYGADCTPTPWPRSAAWLNVGERGFIQGQLRDRSAWANGRPTIDVFAPQLAVYPHAFTRRAYRPMPADSMLSIEQLFALVGRLIDPTVFAADRARAIRPLQDWAQENPRLARLFPANAILRQAMYAAEQDSVRDIPPPIAGTYRFQIIVEGREPRVFFLRTMDRPETRWWRGPGREPWEKSATPQFADSYNLLSFPAPSESSLPRDRAQTYLTPQGYLRAAIDSTRLSSGEWGWVGGIALGFIAARFPQDTLLQALASESYEAFSEHMRLGAHEPAVIAFTRDRHGAVFFSQDLSLPRRRVIITGERISPVTVAEPPRR